METNSILGMDVAVGCILGEEKGAQGDIYPQELITLRHIRTEFADPVRKTFSRAPFSSNSWVLVS
jgi:hypothetical protein